MLAFGCPWTGSGTGLGCADMLMDLPFQDGTPPREQIGGVKTRHLVTTLEPGQAPHNFLAQEARSIHLWVSTDARPTIRQLRVEAVGALKAPIEPAADVAFSPDGNA